MEYFKNLPKPQFKYYDPDRIVLGKTMREQLPFAMAWWHNLGAGGKDMFGSASSEREFKTKTGTMKHAKAKADAGFEFMSKLGIGYFCFHDLDLVPEADTIKETNERLDEISDYLLKKMEETGIKCLWGTANLFNNPRYMNGAGSSNSAEVYCFAAAQIKKALDITVKLGGKGYVFWGGREGYETLLNTNMKLEQDNIARLMKMAVDMGKSVRPDMHLDKDFKLNIEANHATLAGHSFSHELRVAAQNGMLGSIDANQGDLLLGWDTDEFPFDVYETTFAMLEVLKSDGLTGGFNFDAKNRRPSNTYEDMFTAFALGMDSFALGLLKAAAIIEDGRIDDFVKSRYSSWSTGIGADIVSGKATLESLAEYAQKLGAPSDPGSGRQEYLQRIVNEILFK
jgi:xylose isomerase